MQGKIAEPGACEEVLEGDERRNKSKGVSGGVKCCGKRNFNPGHPREDRKTCQVEMSQITEQRCPFHKMGERKLPGTPAWWLLCKSKQAGSSIVTLTQ